MNPSVDSSSSASLPAWLRGDARPLWRRPGVWGVVLVGLAALVGASVWQRQTQAQAAPRFITEPIRRGDLATTVTANGTLKPIRSVSIGSELSGTVARVLVDVNDRVKQGQILVELDKAKLTDQITQSEAALASAKATWRQTQAATQEARANWARLEEVKRLSGGQLPAATELDTAQASLAKAEANEAAAKASITQAEATLSTNRTNLAKASIRAPFDGVILTRAVEPGYAVAASLQAVTLFTLAEDLRQMKLSVDIDEADVGQVQTGQRASFSVSAWPQRKYPATITRVAYGSTTTDNVVTYTTELAVANDDLTLRPGMTATATIAAQEHRGVLLVPNTALSFSPRLGPTAGPGGNSGGSVMDKLMPRPPGMGGNRKASKPTGNARQIWVLQDGQPQPVPVTIGLNNGRQTEVSGEGVREGLAVIVDQQTGGAAP